MATLEAAIQHIGDLAQQYEQQQVALVQDLDDNGEDVFEYFDDKMLH